MFARVLLSYLEHFQIFMVILLWFLNPSLIKNSKTRKLISAMIGKNSAQWEGCRGQTNFLTAILAWTIISSTQKIIEWFQIQTQKNKIIQNSDPKQQNDSRCKTRKNFSVTSYIMFILYHIISYTGVVDSQSINCFMVWLRICIFTWVDFWKIWGASSFIRKEFFRDIEMPYGLCCKTSLKR